MDHQKYKTYLPNKLPSIDELNIDSTINNLINKIYVFEEYLSLLKKDTESL